MPVPASDECPTTRCASGSLPPASREALGLLLAGRFRNRVGRHAHVDRIDRRGAGGRDLRLDVHRRRGGGKADEKGRVLDVGRSVDAERFAQGEFDRVAETLGFRELDRAEPARGHHVDVGERVVLVRQRFVRAEIEREAHDAIGGARGLRHADAVLVAGGPHSGRARLAREGARLQPGRAGADGRQQDVAGRVGDRDRAVGLEYAIHGRRADLDNLEYLRVCGER